VAEAIAYDKPIKNFITELSATGHVTHTSYKKTSVTVHHNAGNLTHEGLLSVWRTRAASAHFDVDAAGNVAQYVKASEYAWAVGDLDGNESSISIEQANATFSPDWTVSETTWKSTARLIGWLFAHVIDKTPRPSAKNVFGHKHWSATECPGPYVVKNLSKIITEAQKAYDEFTSNPGSAPTSPSSSKSIAQVAKEVIAGKWSTGDERVKLLTAAGYNADAIQGEVNRQMGQTAVPKKTVTQVAKEVIAGKWGNGTDRVNRLKSAGYDAKAVQAEVNKLL